jgi:hypothetical protein
MPTFGEVTGRDCKAWRVPASRAAAVVFLHGFGEHSGLYLACHKQGQSRRPGLKPETAGAILTGRAQIRSASLLGGGSSGKVPGSVPPYR